MTVMKLNGPLGGDYQTDGVGNAVLLNSYPLTEDDDVPARLADHEGRVTAAENNVSELRAHNPEAWMDARNHPDGEVTAFDSGQPATFYLSSVAVPLVFDGGALAYEPGDEGVRAAYLRAELRGPITRSGMTFTFDAGSTQGGSVVMLWTPDQYVDGADLGAHCIIRPDVFRYEVRTAPGTFEEVYSYNFIPPLAVDETPYAIEIQRDGDMVTAILPDGSIHSFSHATILANTGPHVAFETFQFLCETDNFPRILTCWADAGTFSDRSSSVTAQSLQRVVSRYQPRIQAVTYAPSTESIVTLTDTPHEFEELRLGVVFPESGLLLVELTLHITATSSLVAGCVSVDGDAYSGVLTRLIDGTTPGTIATVTTGILSDTPGVYRILRAWGIRLTGSSAAAHIWDSGRDAVLKVTLL